MQQVHLRINDAATGKPTPVRLRITDAAGTYYAPFGRLTDFATGVNQDVGGNVLIGAKKWAYIDGTCEILLPPGQLHLEISKGPEYKPIDETITLIAGKMSLRFTIERWCDMRQEGWYSGDTRVHFLSPDAALLEGQAEDVAVVNLLATTQDYRAVDLGDCEVMLSLVECSLQSAFTKKDLMRIRALSEKFKRGTWTANEDDENKALDLMSELSAVFRDAGGSRHSIANILSFSGQSFARQSGGCGVAVNTWNRHSSLSSLGLLHCHRPVYPLTFGEPDGIDNWTLRDWCGQCHRKKGLVVWTDPSLPVYPFPYGEPLADLILGDIDAYELVHEGGLPSRDLAEYYGLCDAELVVPLVAASAKKRNKDRVGSMRTYAHLPADVPLSYTAWIEAVRSGRTYVSNGPILRFTIDGSVPGIAREVSPEHAVMHIRVEARCWSAFEGVELLWNGEPLERASPDSERPARALLDYELSIEESGWLAVRCTGDGVLAHSSAVAVRRSDAPKWAPPQVVRRFLDELDRMLQWAKNEARCETAAQRERLCHVFEEARTVLAKKLS
ncbi:MAG: hypothetical protein HYR84_00425 [Planctomycetes bacterium]|nr:hypothetical protein [Planctomycetota bacterium]